MNAQEKWVGSKSLALLRQGPFRRYILGSLISDSGTWMQMMAQSWVMSGLTNKAMNAAATRDARHSTEQTQIQRQDAIAQSALPLALRLSTVDDVVNA